MTDLPLIFRLIDLMATVRAAAQTGGQLDKVLKDHAGGLMDVLTDVGEDIFPGITADLAPQAAAQAMFFPERTKWAQALLNQVTGSRLGVDGVYGPETRTAVKAFQTAHKIAADGWVSDETATALHNEAMARGLR